MLLSSLESSNNERLKIGRKSSALQRSYYQYLIRYYKLDKRLLEGLLIETCDNMSHFI